MNKKKITPNSAFSFLPYCILFLWSFIFFAFVADYACFYQEKTSFFVLSGDYLNNFILQPGSLLLYMGNLLTSFYYYPVAGSVIISSVICLSVFLISRIITSISGIKSILIPILFGSALFFLQTDYRFLLFNNLGILFQLLFFYLSIRYLKGFLPVIALPFFYYLTGGFSFIFCLMYTLYIILTSFKRDWTKIAALWIFIMLIIYVLSEYFLFQSFKTLLFYPISVSGTGQEFKIFLAVTAFIVLLPLVSKIRIRPAAKAIKSDFIRNIVTPVILLLILMVASFVRFDSKTKEYFHVERLFYQDKYNEITDYLLKNPSTNILTIYMNNIALCETGKLNDQLFNYRQSPDGQTLFLKWEMYGEVLRRGTYFYYTIGMINEAQRWAYENMVNEGMTPEGLKILIRTEIILGNYEMASKYNSILMKTLFYRDTAKEYNSLLFNDGAVEAHPELGAKRREKVTHDFFVITDDPYVNIERIMSSDSLNHKAYEYKLAYNLIKKDYKAVVSELPYLEKHGLKKIPVHLQEAALVYRVSNMGPLPDSINLPFDKTIETRFTRFLEILKSYGNNPKAAGPVLSKQFGDTYWYWAVYR